MAEKDKKKPTTVKVTKKEENSDEEEENKQQTAKRPVTATAPLEAVDGWSVEQQKQMEDGMKQIPASVPAKQRWV